MPWNSSFARDNCLTKPIGAGTRPINCARRRLRLSKQTEAGNLRCLKEIPMFCPVCRSEYRVGFTECAECKVPLVESLPTETAAGEPDLKLVSIYETGDPALIALAESI